MIDVTPNQLMLQVTRSEIESKKRYRLVQDQHRRYRGLAHDGKEGGTIEPENYAWSYSLHTVARLTAAKQNIQFSTKRPVASARVEGLEDFCEQWGPDTGWKRERERCMVDSCFGQVCAVIAQEPRQGFEHNARPVMTPRAHRLSLAMFGVDPDATSTDDARFLWHKVISDRNDLEKRAASEDGWSLEAIKALAEKSADEARNRPEKMSDREALVWFSVWVRGYLPPGFTDGMDPREIARYSGSVFSLAEGDSGALELRAPQPQFGHKEGPYAVGGLMFVPDDPYMLGALTACDGQIKQLNAQARANDVSAARRKAIALVDALTDEAKAVIISAVDGDVVGIPGLDSSKVATIEVGGITAEARQRELELRVRTNQALMMSDQVRGETTGVGTATENIIADKANANISGFSDTKWNDFEREVYKRVAWFADQDYRTALRRDGTVYLGGMTKEEQLQGVALALDNGLITKEEADAAQITIDPESEIQRALKAGEISDEQAAQLIEQHRTPDPLAYDDLELHIETLKSGAEQQAALSAAFTIVNETTATLIQGAPFISNIDDLMDLAADTLEIPALRGVFDLDAAKEAFQAAQDAENAPAPKEPRTVPAPQRPTPTPRPSAGGGGQRPGNNTPKVEKAKAS